jgi:hypothetical protein
MATKRTLLSIPSIDSGVHPSIKQALDSLVTQLNNMPYLNGDGLATVANVTGIVGDSLEQAIEDYDIPPKITGIRTISGQGAIVVMWDRQAYASFAHTEVWRNSSGVLDGTEQQIGTGGTFIYTDLLPNDNAGTQYYYWLKGVSNTTPPITGEFNTVAGTLGTVSAGTAGNIGGGKLPDSSTIELGTGVQLIPAGNGAANFGTGVQIKGDNEGSINVGGDIILSGVGQGTIDLGTGAVTMGGDGSIILSKPGGIIGQDYVIMTNGEIQYMVWDGTQHVLGKALRQVSSGTANSGDTVSVPVYFKNEPTVTVSLNTLMAFNAAEVLQDQQWEVRYENLREDPVGSGFWKFDAVCRLSFAAGSGNTLVGTTGNNAADNTNIYSPVQETGLNCNAFSPSITCSSKEFSDATTTYNYKYKNAVWRVAYSTDPGLASPTYTLWQTKAIGATFDSVSDSMAITGLVANKWYFRTELYFEDAGGTFPSGAVEYTLSQDTVSNNITFPEAYSDYNTVGDWDYETATLPAYDPGTKEIYQVNYSMQVAGYSHDKGRPYFRGAFLVTTDSNESGYWPTSPYPTFGTKTWQLSSYVPTCNYSTDSYSALGRALCQMPLQSLLKRLL